MNGWYNLIPVLIMLYVVLILAALLGNDQQKEEEEPYIPSIESYLSTGVDTFDCISAPYPKAGMWRVAYVCVEDGELVTYNSLPESDIQYQRYIKPIIDSLKHKQKQNGGNNGRTTSK